MLQTSQPTVFVRISSCYEQTRATRTPSTVRCLFGRPNSSDVRRQLDEELAKNCKRFSSRYEICPPSPSKSLSPSYKKNDDSQRSRVDTASQKRQKLLTEYWPKKRDYSNSKNSKSS